MNYGISIDRRHDYTVSYPKDEHGEAIDAVIEANITGVIGCLDKSGVMIAWAKREVALAAVRNVHIVTQMVEQQPVTEGALAYHPAVQYLKGIPGYQRDKAADIGTRVHAVGEALGKGQKPKVDEDIMPMAVAYYRGFIERYRPRFHPDYVEFKVASIEHDYAGTMDMACRIGDEVWLLDIKTSTKEIGLGERDFPYSETALQLAAGRFAEFVGKPGDPKRYPIPPATRFGVVAVTAEGCELVEYRVTPQDWETFLALRTAWGWLKDRKANVKVGIPEAPVKEEAA